MREETVDIMMLTYGRWAYTQKTIASVVENTTWPYRLLVTDNGSVDGTRKGLGKLVDAGVVHKLYLEHKNLGNAVGKNIELERAESRYVCLLDNDMQLNRGWLRKCMEAMLHFSKEKLVLMSPWPIWKFAPNTHIGDLRDKKFHVLLTRKLSGQVWIGARKPLLKVGFQVPDDGRFMGFFASPLSKTLVKRGYKIGCVAGEKSLAISMDRSGSRVRDQSKEMELYREWNKLQKNKHQVLPDFHVWLKNRKKGKKK